MEKETLQAFGVKSLANASYGAFMEAVKSLIAKGTTEKLGLKAEDFSAFEALLVQLLEVNNGSKKDATTKELDALDEQRDRLLTHLFARVALEAGSPDETSQKAWLQLMGLRELYKGIQRKPTREETYLIKGLLVDAGKAEHNAAFVKLGLKPMLDQLKAINEDYEKKTASRAASQVANTLTPAKELRKQLDQYYEAFMMKIGALAIVSPNPELEAFVKAFNKLAKDTRERWKLHLAQLGLWTEEGGREDEDGNAESETEAEK